MQDVVVEKGTKSAEKISLPMDSAAWKETQVDLSSLGQSLTTT